MFAPLLLSWYDVHKRTLPFRGTKDPYRVWVSEIMLQQTRTETVGAYYERFMARFPDVYALARADEQDVLKCWEGLGYYSRARNLHKTAKVIVEQHGGAFPANLDALRALPGVGDYTAAAVASIAFDLPAPAMDGNLTRVLSRFHGVREDVGAPSVKRRLMDLAREDMPAVRCGDFNQALMDLGATICVPGTPDCERCPLRTLCDACQAGDAEDLPIKAAQKPPKEIQMSVALVTFQGRIWMTERTETLLKGLWVYALTENADAPADIEKSLNALGIQAKYRQTLGPARHVFTHRVWNMTVRHFAADSADCRAGRFVTLKEMLALPVPTAMRFAKSAAVDMLTPAIKRVELAEESQLSAVARAYSESWTAAHAWRCDADFVAAHTPARMEKTLRDHLAAGREVYGLWISQRAVGVLVLDQAENELVSLYIHPDYHRLGVGRAAVRFAVSALDEGRDMKLTVLYDNAPALRLYESFGFRRVLETHVLNPDKDTVEEVRLRTARYFLPLAALHPSQLYISEEKLAAVRAWFRPDDLTGFEPVPVKRAGSVIYMTDGHTRAVAAYLAGLQEIPVTDDPDDLDGEAYAACLRWCDEEGADTVEKLSRRVVHPADYQRLWDARCDELHRELEEKRRDA